MGHVAPSRLLSVVLTILTCFVLVRRLRWTTNHTPLLLPAALTYTVARCLLVLSCPPALRLRHPPPALVRRPVVVFVLYTVAFLSFSPVLNVPLCLFSHISLSRSILSCIVYVGDRSSLSQYFRPIDTSVLYAHAAPVRVRSISMGVAHMYACHYCSFNQDKSTSFCKVDLLVVSLPRGSSTNFPEDVYLNAGLHSSKSDEPAEVDQGST